MIECQHPHPDFPSQQCKAKVKSPIVTSSSFGQVMVECWRCHGPVAFDFEATNTEAVDKQPVMA